MLCQPVTENFLAKHAHDTYSPTLNTSIPVHAPPELCISGAEMEFPKRPFLYPGRDNLRVLLSDPTNCGCMTDSMHRLAPSRLGIMHP